MGVITLPQAFSVQRARNSSTYRETGPNKLKSYIKLFRSEHFDELVKKHHNEFILLSVVARRARRTPDKINGLDVGEAFLGDFAQIGLTRQKYRSALKNLKKWKFLTFKTTNKGTTARLIDKTVYDINEQQDNQQDNQTLTISQPSSNHQVTTNKNVKNGKNEKNEDHVLVIDYLNLVCGTSYKPSTKKTIDVITARKKEGFELKDFKTVIRKKHKEWSKTDMVKFLRPETLFGTKFEGYLNQPENIPERQGPKSFAEKEGDELDKIIQSLQKPGGQVGLLR